MSWLRFQNEYWSALRPTGFRQARVFDSADPALGYLPNDERGDDVLDGRKNRAAETPLDGRQERQPDRGPPRQRRDPQRGDWKGAQARPGWAGQIAELGPLASPPFRAVVDRPSRRRASHGFGRPADDAR